MQGDWELTKDGYDRSSRFVDHQGQVVGEVTGSEFTREWTAFYWLERPPKWLGKFTTERAAQDAIMREIKTQEKSEWEAMERKTVAPTTSL